MHHAVKSRGAVLGTILGTVLGVGLLFFAPVSPAAAEDAPIVLAPHRAIYDLSLKETRNNSQIAGVSGRIVYDFSGNACEG